MFHIRFTDKQAGNIIGVVLVALVWSVGLTITLFLPRNLWLFLEFLGFIGVGGLVAWLVGKLTWDREVGYFIGMGTSMALVSGMLATAYDQPGIPGMGPPILFVIALGGMALLLSTMLKEIPYVEQLAFWCWKRFSSDA